MENLTFFYSNIILSTFVGDYWPTISGAILAILAGIIGWWQNRPGQKKDQFQTFMDASSEFREEVRKEQENLRKEVKDLHVERNELKTKLDEYEEIVDKCKIEINIYKEKLEKLQIEVARLIKYEQHKEILENLPQIVWTATPEGNVNYYNETAYRYMNIPPSRGKNLDWVNFFHPNDKNDALNIWANCVKTGDTYYYEYRLRRGVDRTYRWFLGVAVPIIGENGEITKWVGTCVDIHDYKMGLVGLMNNLFSKMSKEGIKEVIKPIDFNEVKSDVKFLT